ncbi:MAG: hypothetical protein FJ096_12140 [Deltaproteobacteria bacterium]|nr:hypothetical protein [Deltaproteobacteria bacterium]
MMPSRRSRPIAVVAALALGLVASAGCKRDRKPTTDAQAATADDPPTVRLYLMSDVSGALEPCGCSKDQLGGLDHLAAFVRSQRERAPNSLLLHAGPLLYIDPTLEPARASQDRWKAEAIADGLKSLGLAAFVPGFNDWADGGESLARVAGRSGAKVLAAGLGGERASLDVQASALFDVGKTKVGVVGVSAPRDGAGKPPKGVEPPATEAVVALVKKEIDSLRARGAQVLVASVALQRGAALRIADAVPELDVLLIGKEVGRGHANTSQPAPELIGSTLVVETANHAQSIAVVDVHLRADDPDPKLADAGGVAQAAKVGDLSRRIRELEVRINGWESEGKARQADIAARKADLATLRAERDALTTNQPAPTGSFFRFAVHEVRDGMGKDDAVSARMLSLYKQINEHNKSALADLRPPAPEKNQARFLGVEECSTCHEEERTVWDGTAHAHAYKTLVDGFKEFNLECVGCHVTGYGKAGGSTVTHNAKLQSVQCEECHGPGSLHAKDPEKRGLILRKPDPKSCVEACHHSPHVEGFDAVAKMNLVLGPGHGRD